MACALNTHAALSSAVAPRARVGDNQGTWGNQGTWEARARVPAATGAASHGAVPFSINRRPVKTLLSEFNAQRMLGRMIKGAHRRLSADKGSPTATLPPC